MVRRSRPSPSHSNSTRRVCHIWGGLGVLLGFVLGRMTSSTGGGTGLFSLASGSMRSLQTINQDDAVHNLPPPVIISGAGGVVDLLPHLKNCDKPQSNRTLTEMAAHYKPTKFYGYMHANYDRFYPQYMEKYRTKYFRMLEIGLDTGAGSLLWQEYFPCATLVGLEANVDNTRNQGASTIHSVVGDQSNVTYLKTDFLEQTDGGHFDLIVDDGGHHYEMQRTSYEVLFDLALNPGGLYIIEDIETSYWAKGTNLYYKRISRGGWNVPNTIVNEFRDVVHVINKKFHDNTHTVFGQVDQLISKISFGSNIIFLEKKTREECYNERPYIWPHNLAHESPARTQPVDANKRTLIQKFCEGIDIFVRDDTNQMRSGGVV